MKFSTFVKTTIAAIMIFFMFGCETTTEVNMPSQIAILNPADGSVLTEQTEVTFSIVNDDDLSYVQIFIDGFELDRFYKGTNKWDFTPAFYNDGLKHTIIAVTTDSDDQQNQSDVVSFQVGSSAVLNPVYISPMANQVYEETEEINIAWELIPNAVNYTIQLSEDKYFGTILSEKTVTETQVSFGVLPVEVYYFRLKAENKAGKIADWSSNRKIYVGIYDFTWMNEYNYGGGAEWANDVIILPDSTFITGGPCWNEYMEYSKISIVKTDLMGNTIWNKIVGAENAVSYANGIVQSGDHIYIAGGQYDNSGSDKILLIKMDLDGNEIWTKTYGTYSSWGFKVEVDNEGFIYMTCDYEGRRSLAKFSADGSLIYTYTPENSGNWIYFVFDKTEKLFVMYGDYSDIPHLVNLDENGVPISDIEISGQYIYSARGIVSDDSGIYMIYSSNDFIKIGYDGTVLNEYSDPNNTFYSLQVANGMLYACGYDYSDNASMIKLDSTLGEPITNTYGTGMLLNLKILDDGSAILCGTNSAWLNSSSNMLLIKTDVNGECDGKITEPEKIGEKLQVKFDRVK